MKAPEFRVSDTLRLFFRDRSGASAVIAALLMPVLLGMAALAIDLSRVYVAQRTLQNATDAAALAGAQDIYTQGTTQAIATANNYSATTGNRNAVPFINASMAAGFPQVTCLSGETSAFAPCLGPDSANVIKVRQTADVPLLFGPIVGVSSITVNTTSLAAAKGGRTKALDVAIVIDATGSMDGSDNRCGIAGATRLICAKAGIRAMLMQLDPSIDYVSLLAFPGTTNSTEAAKAYDCSTSAPIVQSYASNPLYSFVPLTNGYRADVTSPLTTSNSLVRAASGGGSGCAQGIPSTGGVGTYYADVITAAQALLVNTGHTNSQKVIVFLSDGDASANSSDVPSGMSSNQCQRGVQNARNATSAGTWVYSIAYGAASSGCSTDTTNLGGLSPTITLRNACNAMQNIASDLSKFYTDATCPNARTISNLVTIFTSIGAGLKDARLLRPDAT